MTLAQLNVHPKVREAHAEQDDGEITGLGLRQAKYVIENDGGLAHSDCETFRRMVVDDRELEMVKSALDPYFSFYVSDLENVLPYGMMVGPAPWDNPYLARPGSQPS